MLPKWLKIARKRAQDAAEPAGEGVRSTGERLAALEVRIGEIERQWAEVLDKINRWAARQAARQRKELSEQLETLNAEAPVAEGSAAAAGGDKAALRRMARERFNRRVG